MRQVYNFCSFSVLRIHFLDCLDASSYPGLAFAPGWHEQLFKRGIQSGSIWWGGGIVGRAGGSYEAEEGEEGLLGGASHSHYAILCQALPHHCIVCHTIIKFWQPHSIRCHISIT